jgi:FtsP/CotA-like multicopper oxidase with cupredoxin domain
MTLIAVDGQYVQPIATNFVDCGNGERYDVLVEANAPETDAGVYWAVAQSRYRAVTVAGAARVIYKDKADAEWGNAAGSSSIVICVILYSIQCSVC